MKFDQKIENLKRSDISGPTLIDPINDEKESVVKVLLELPKSSVPVGSGNFFHQIFFFCVKIDEILKSWAHQRNRVEILFSMI